MADSPPLELDERGLVPVVVQDHLSGEIRMVAYATIEAIHATLATGRATFWSRSRRELWEKGRSSGNTLTVRRVLVDCDADCLIYSAEPQGPTCHTGRPSCFYRSLRLAGGVVEVDERLADPQTLITRLQATLEARKSAPVKASYTKSLYEGGAATIGAKLCEEAVELARAIADEAPERVAEEAADVLYHWLVGLRWRGVPVRAVLEVLERRTARSGLAEKASRTSQATGPARRGRRRAGPAKTRKSRGKSR